MGVVLVKDEFFRKLEPMLSSSSQPEESSSYESDDVTTLLSKLFQISNLARKRRISRNPARSSKRSKAAVTTEPKIVESESFLMNA